LTGASAFVLLAILYFSGSIQSYAMGLIPTASQAGSSSSNSAMSQIASSVESITISSSAISSAVDDSQLYKDGIYEGSGTGYRGAVTTVKVTVTEGKIESITVVSTGDDDKFFNRAYPVVTQSITAAQSTDVDTVSGATFSSDGIIQAVENALSAAT
jgi:uncharacterized protein with FMN-binding domain